MYERRTCRWTTPDPEASKWKPRRAKGSEIFSDEVRFKRCSTSASIPTAMLVDDPVAWVSAVFVLKPGPSTWTACAEADDSGVGDLGCESADSVASNADVCRRVPKASK